MYFFLRTTSLRIVGLIDEISTKRINIEEKIRGHFYLLAYGVIDL